MIATLGASQKALFVLARAQRSSDGADDGGQNRYEDDAQHDGAKMLLDERDAAEEVAYQHEQADPADAADSVEQRELGEVHVPGSGDKRGKRTEKRHEARDDDGKPAVLLEEVVQLGHALGRERLHLARIENAAAEEPSNPVI